MKAFHERHPRWLAARGWTPWVVGVGVLLSLWLYGATRSMERQEQQARVREVVREQGEKLEISILRSMEVLNGIVSLYAAHNGLDGPLFREFVQGALRRQPELEALSWNPWVPAEKRSEFERRGEPGGTADFHFWELDSGHNPVVSPTREAYVPIHLIEPMDRNAPALGYDLLSDPARRECLEKARDSGQAMATVPLHLAQDRMEQEGILVVQPIYRAGPPPGDLAERRLRLAGYSVAVFQLAHLVDQAFAELDRAGIAARLTDRADPVRILYENQRTKHFAGSFPATLPLSVAGRQWLISYALVRSGWATANRQSLGVLAGGLAITILAGLFLAGSARRRQLILDANRALQAEVTTRKYAELAAARANEAKSSFLASMSHEIRTPLNAILGYAQILQRDPLLDGSQRDGIDAIGVSGQHLLRLINEILDLSKIEAGRMEVASVPFDLARLAHDLEISFRPSCARKRIGLRVELPRPGPIPVRGDDGKLRQILINLLGNAVKFTHAGEVALRLAASSETAWTFVVTDTGLGIPPEEQAHIFKPFYQGRGAGNQLGTGLGLTIAQRQVELLGGRLELMSERGAGSRFSFTLSLPAELSSHQPDAGPTRGCRLRPGRTLRALVVDDVAANRRVLQAMLELTGCETSGAAGVAEARGVIHKQAPDVVFLDWLMPAGGGRELAASLGGPGAVPALGRDSAPIKVIAHSAAALPSQVDEMQAMGCLDFLAKPFQVERLHEVLLRHFPDAMESADAPVDAGAEELLRPLPVDGVELPEELCARLEVAAELHSATALKGALAELRALGDGAEVLAEHIRVLMRSYDMTGIQRLLNTTVRARGASLAPAPTVPNGPTHGA